MVGPDTIPPRFEYLESRLLLSASSEFLESFASARAVEGGALDGTTAPNPIDDIGNTFEDAVELQFYSHWDGALAYARGTINYAGDVDMMSFVAAESGRVTVMQRGRGRRSTTGLAGQVAAYDAEGNLLATDAAADGADASVSFRVVAGQRYYMGFAGAGDATGYYFARLTAVPDPFASAEVVDVGVDGAVTVTGVLAEAGQSVAYLFTAAASGTITVDMEADGDALDPYLELYQDPGRISQRSDNASPDTVDARLGVRVQAGDTYYVVASGVGDTVGRFELTLTSDPIDDFANTADGARPVALDLPTGGAAAHAMIDYAGDLDVIAFVAPETGTMTVEQRVWDPSSAVSADLWVHDADGNLIGHDADAGDRAASLAFGVVGGRTYYATFGSVNNATGWYGVQITTDAAAPYPSPDPAGFADADALDLSVGGRVTVDGTITAQTGSHLYRVTAPATGYLDVTVAGDGSGLDAYLEVYGHNLRLLGQNGEGLAGSSGGRLSFRVQAGATYYVRACGTGGTVGGYTLEVASKPTDDCGNTVETGGVIRTDSETGGGAAAGRIDYAGDLDMMALVASQTGVMHIDQTVWGYSATFSGELTVYDAEGNELAHDADGSDAAAAVSLSVTGGQRYYVAFGGLDGTTGWYTVTVTTEASPPDPNPPDDGYTPGVVVLAHVLDDGTALQLVVVGTDEADTISLSQASDSVTLTTAWGTTTYAGSFSATVVYGFGGADTIRLSHTVTATSEVYGGTGDDQLFEAGPGEGWLYGEAGDDLLVTVGGGSDHTVGGAGLDSFWVDGADALEDVEAAETLAASVHQITAFYQPTSDPAEHVSLEIAGQDIVDPEASGRYRDYGSRPLFVDGPQYDDIRQGAVGDCYFLASLASLADTDPGVIEQMIAPMGDGTYAVRYYRRGEAVYVRVDAELSGTSISPRYAKLTPDGELWVALVEKAYAQFRKGQNSYASISGGWMDPVYRAVTGGETSRLWPTSSTIASDMAGHLDAGHAVTVASNTNPPGPAVGLHAYMVKSVETDGGQTYVTIYNPWGVDGQVYDGNSADGLLRLTLAQFRANFSTVVVSLA